MTTTSTGSSRLLRIALIQQSFSSDLESNRKKLADNLAQACAQADKPQLVVFSELHNNVYFCQEENDKYFATAESVPGPTTEWLCALAKKHHIVLVGSVFEKTAAGEYYNTALVAESNGTLVGTYHKTHIPYDPGYYEQYYFKPSSDGLHPIDTSVGRLGLMVCFDQWFPEASRTMALAGAEMLIYPTAIGYDLSLPRERQLLDRDAWVTVQRGQSVANLLPVLSCNRVGYEPALNAAQSSGLNFWGTSFVTGPQGEFLAKAADDREEIISATLDLERGAELAKIWTFVRDRKPQVYFK